MPKQQIPLNEHPKWRPFAERYAGDIYRFAVEVLGVNPSDQQAQMMAAVEKPRSRVSVASGHGCFGKGTEILMSDGTIKRAEDIKRGDEVMGADGRPNTVMSLISDESMLYRVTLNNGHGFVCNGMHRLCLYATNTKGKRSVGDQVIVTVKDWLKWGADKKRCHGMATSAIESFDVAHETMIIDPYIMGLWIAEGCQTDGVFSLNKHDYEFIKNDIDAFCKKHDFRQHKRLASNNCFSLRISGGFSRMLRDEGVVNNKHVPKKYTLASMKDRLEFLAGIIDGDGCPSKGSVEVAQKQKQVADSIAFIARSCGMTCRVKETTKTCANTGKQRKYYRVLIGRGAEKIPCRVTRKRKDICANPKNRIGISSILPIGVGRFFGFTLSEDKPFLDSKFFHVMNTGKSFSHSIIILWHLLCYYKSWTLITANDIDQIKASTMKEVAGQIGRIKNGPHAWIHEYIEFMASGDIRVKGFQQNWMCELKTANAKNANKMAGRHAKWLLIIVDEASTVPDSVMTTLRGALTEANNRMFMTSQGTRTGGFFYDTHNKFSKANGGEWDNLMLSSLDSPHVSDEAFLSLWNSYDDDERRVRLLGMFPQDSSKLFLSRREVEGVYKRGRIIKDSDAYGIFILADIASGEGLRDKSAVSVARVYGYGDMGEDARRVEIIDVPFLTNNIRANKFAHYVAEVGAQYSNPTYVVDSGGLGINVCQSLEDMGKVVQRVNWGNTCFRNQNKQRYLNLRAQATHQMARAVREGRFSVLTSSFQNIAIDQMARIPKTFTDGGKLRVPPKHSTEWEGMGSPDLADTFAFAFLETAQYIAADKKTADNAVSSAASTQQAAEESFADIQ